MSKNKIKVCLYNNAYSPQSNSFVARVKQERSLNAKEICKFAITRNKAKIAPEVMEQIVDMWLNEMALRLNSGHTVDADWFIAYPRIKGVFSGLDEKFNPEKHSIEFSFTAGKRLLNEAKAVSVTVLGKANAIASISQVADVSTLSENNLLTPGKNLRIVGNKIKIKGADPLNGLYFVNQGNFQRIKVANNDVVVNKPSELIVVIPALEKGFYKLELLSQYTGSVLLKKPRETIFEKKLTVK